MFDGHGFVNHAIWADNSSIFASSGHELKAMFEMLTKANYDNHLKWKAQELTFINGTNDKHSGDIDVDTPDGYMLLRYVGEMKVLGVMVDNRGSAGRSIDFNDKSGRILRMHR